MNEELHFETDGDIAIITIDRPAQRNSLGRLVREGLFAAFERFDRDDTLNVAILTARGDKAFCAGMDLKEMSGSAMAVPPRNLVPVLGDNAQVGKPVIAAVNGIAYAGGWLLAQMCDLCVAAEHATFAITEAKVGRGMPWAAPLVRMLPQRIVMEVLLTGEPLTARRAYELGFVNAVVPGERLLDEALALAGRIARNAPLTVRAARELVYLAGDMGRAAGLQAARRLFDHVYLSSDAQEGPRAFVEKRPPRWTGR